MTLNSTSYKIEKAFIICKMGEEKKILVNERFIRKKKYF